MLESTEDTALCFLEAKVEMAPSASFFRSIDLVVDCFATVSLGKRLGYLNLMTKGFSNSLSSMAKHLGIFGARVTSTS